ncbi:hypothetical protein TIFTF001_020019 [Ficus carica]|uniref:CTLH domain-containing protein n=1 Tax=Ficus carica TaxID=3494 RepID=A0AA88AXG5_FICCA|nr:hypothetical protein TIFTF001_020019 [Ficus carica]
MRSEITNGPEGDELMSLFWIVIRQPAEIEAMATSKRVITREEWEKKLNDVKIRKEDMNKLVMNFLVTEGYVEAAEKFRMESGTEPDIDIATITDRMAVKKAVQCGNVEDAIEKVNDLNPEILDTNPQLFFHLQQQRLIELIRNGKVEEALEFAQEELAPRGEENQSFLEELEKTVALLAFEDVSNCPVGELLDISQRLKTASEVNAAILTSQSHEKECSLASRLRVCKRLMNLYVLLNNRPKASKFVEDADMGPESARRESCLPTNKRFVDSHVGRPCSLKLVNCDMVRPFL